MCAVSFISDHYRDPYRYQRPPQPLVPPPLPQPIPWPTGLPPSSLPWTREALDQLKDILKRLDALDKKLGLAECEDPKKAEWMKGIEERIAKLEQPRKRKKAAR